MTNPPAELDALSELRIPMWDSGAVWYVSMQNNVGWIVRKPGTFARAVVRTLRTMVNVTPLDMHHVQRFGSGRVNQS